jgi:hypothetical protein
MQTNALNYLENLLERYIRQKSLKNQPTPSPAATELANANLY